MDALTTYKMGSLFDGSGGFPLAGALCGIEPCWASEVEPYPIAVTRTRFPMMKHLGDISKINGAEVEPVDIITFGSPCQDLSVAGKRAGLKHEANGDEETTRSGLFMDAVRLIKEMREATNGKYPSFALWENVPGAFSSNKGEDFRLVCEELIKIIEPSASMPNVPKGGWAYADSFVGDGWGLAWRVFDAQYWGVPQRRRRIHLVLDLRGERAREVLFEREGVRGYFTEGRTPWQGIAENAQGSTGADDREGEGTDGHRGLDVVAGVYRKGARPSRSEEPQSYEETERANTLTAFDRGRHSELVVVPVHDQATRFSGKRGDKEDGKGNGLGVGKPGEPMYTPTSGDRHAVTYGFDQGATRDVGDLFLEETSKTLANGSCPGHHNGVVISVDEKMGQTYTREEQADTLAARDYKQPQAVAYGLDRASFNQGQNALFDFSVTEEQPPCLTAKGPGAVCHEIKPSYIVRRLTPTECARLQGFADRWGDIEVKDSLTDEEYRFWLEVRNTHAVVINGRKAQEYTVKQMLTWYNKLQTDSAEYKMWGNGIALPPALYCMQGIVEALDKEEEDA